MALITSVLCAVPVHASTIPAAAFAMFQMLFAAITPLLMTGTFAERMCFRSVSAAKPSARLSFLLALPPRPY